MTSSLTATSRYSKPTRPDILTTYSDLSEFYPQVNKTIGPLSYRNFGLAMVAAGIFGWRVLVLAAAAVATIAAISIYAQIGRTEVWLGGTLTTAAVFACAAVVGV